jgi:hypothetical protein
VITRTQDEYKRDMLDALPKYYEESRIAGNILDREAKELADLDAAIKDVLDQYFIDTATWGLAKWEAVCGIPTDETKPLDQRRSVIKSKLRGIGTVTVEMIKNVAEAYLNGEVDVTNNYANYEVIVTFIGKRGIPANLNDIQTALRDIIPAHLGVTFTFTYLVWDELDARVWTWDAFDSQAFTWDSLEVYQP